VAEAVLTPRNNDLESGIWTRAAPLTSVRISEEFIMGKKKCSALFASNENSVQFLGISREIPKIWV
jgi:hypothetical protein